MLSIENAIEQLLHKASPITDTETVVITDAHARILAEDITSTLAVPPADNSAMDGYAIHTHDLNTAEANTTLPVSQVITAGAIALPLMAGTAARIFTGAEIPEGANAVVMQEQCTANNGTVSDSISEKSSNTVTLPSNIQANNNIRPQGQDIQFGDTILHQGRQLQPQDVGLLAAVGRSTVTVYRPLTVAILSTGNELIEPGQPLAQGQIYNSNRYLLQSFLQKMGIKVITSRPVADTQAATIAALQSVAHADCIISTGGVSVGDEDHIKAAVEHLGELNFWRIAIKPGKPVAFGSIHHGNQTINRPPTPFIGLPGNPASVFITFLLLATPFLRALQHQPYRAPLGVFLPANFSWKENPKRQEYLRAKINDNNTIDIYTNQSSGVLTSTSWAEGLAVIPAATAIKNGDSVKFIPFSSLI